MSERCFGERLRPRPAGQRQKTLRVLTVIQPFSRSSPIIDPKFSLSIEDFSATLEQSASASAIRRRSASIKALNPLAVKSTRGPMPERDAGLLAARQADRPRLHRGLQRLITERLLERRLISDACGRGRKDGGMAQTLYRYLPARADRKQASARCRNSAAQPVTGREAGRQLLGV
jgi:hypothetical protein